MQLAKPFAKDAWSATVALAAGDTTKVIKASPGAGKKLVVTKWSYRSTTAAAQTMTIGDGTIVLDSLAVSLTVGSLTEGPTLDVGIPLTAATALSITPAAAGPAGRVIAEGYIDNA